MAPNGRRLSLQESLRLISLEKRLKKLEKAATKPRHQQFKKDRRNRYHGKGGANKEQKGEPEK